MGKVKVSKAVYDALKLYESPGNTKSRYNIERIREKSKNMHNQLSKSLIDWIDSDEKGYERYFRALFEGYEIEKNPEEKLLQCYRNTGGNEWGIGYREGVRKTLEFLDIKIEGING